MKNCNNLDSFRISLKSFRSVRGPLLHKPITGKEQFFAVSYSKPALVEKSLLNDKKIFFGFWLGIMYIVVISILALEGLFENSNSLLIFWRKFHNWCNFFAYVNVVGHFVRFYENSSVFERCVKILNSQTETKFFTQPATL